jgi:hypothetical protein
VALLALTAGCSSSAPIQHATQSPSTPTTSTSGSEPSQTSQPVPSPSSSAVRAVRVTDASFVSADQGWVVRGGKLLQTGNGGRTWTRLPGPPATVRHIRFAANLVGYAWGNNGRLWLTTDGARSWRYGGLHHVVSLEPSGGVVWAIAGPQPGAAVWRVDAGSAQWTDLGITPNRSATLDVHGATAYVLGQSGAGPIAPALAAYSADGSQRDVSLPCRHRHTYVPNAPLGVATDGTVFLVCDIEQPHHRQVAYLSHDQGRTWTSTPPPPRPVEDVTATRDRLFAWDTELLVQRSGAWKAAPAGRSTRTGFVLVGFEDDSQGIALRTNGVLRITRDGGRHWTRVHF